MAVDETLVLAILEQAQQEAAEVSHDTQQAQASAQATAMAEQGATPEGKSSAQAITDSVLSALSANSTTPVAVVTPTAYGTNNTTTVSNSQIVGVNKQNIDPVLTQGLDTLDAMARDSDSQVQVIKTSQQALQQWSASGRDANLAEYELARQNIDATLEAARLNNENDVRVAEQAEGLNAAALRELQYLNTFLTPEYHKRVSDANAAAWGYNPDGTAMNKREYKKNAAMLGQQYQAMYSNLIAARERVPQLQNYMNNTVIAEANAQARNSAEQLRYEGTQAEHKRASLELAISKDLSTAQLANYAAQLKVEQDVLLNIISSVQATGTSVQQRANMIQYRTEEAKVQLQAKQFKSMEDFANAWVESAKRVNAEKGTVVVDPEQVRKVAMSGPTALFTAMQNQGTTWALLQRNLLVPGSQVANVKEGIVPMSQFLATAEQQNWTSASPEEQQLVNAVRILATSPEAEEAGLRAMHALSGKKTEDKKLEAIPVDQRTPAQQAAYIRGRDEYVNNRDNWGSSVVADTFTPPFGGVVIQTTQAGLAKHGANTPMQLATLNALQGTKLGSGTVSSPTDVSSSLVTAMIALASNDTVTPQEKEAIVSRVIPSYVKELYSTAASTNSRMVKLGLVTAPTSFGAQTVNIPRLMAGGFGEFMAGTVSIDPTDPLSLLKAWKQMQLGMTWGDTQASNVFPNSLPYMSPSSNSQQK